MKETPYQVDSLAELPATWQVAAARALPPAEPPERIVVIPRHTQTTQKRRRFVPAQALVLTTGGLLQLQEAYTPDQSLTVRYLRGAELLVIRHTLILLYGCLELEGLVQGGPARLVVEYNTVGLTLVLPMVQSLLRQAYGPPAVTAPPEEPPARLLERLAVQSFKFRSGLELYALLPEERLWGYVWQPRITRRIGGLFRQGVTPQALLALTDRAVIAIQEEKAKGAAYGWQMTFCPRWRIATLTMVPQRQGYRVELTVSGVAWRPSVWLEPEQAAAWEVLWGAPKSD